MGSETGRTKRQERTRVKELKRGGLEMEELLLDKFEGKELPKPSSSNPYIFTKVFMKESGEDWTQEDQNLYNDYTRKGYVVEIPEWFYDNLLGSVPPRFLNPDAFLVGETCTHRGNEPVYLCCMILVVNGIDRYFCTRMTAKQYRSERQRVIEFINNCLTS